jgi:putative intracellular protease/amidase
MRSFIPAVTVLCGISPRQKLDQTDRVVLAAGKPIALVCHAPGVLRHVTTSNGKPLVGGKKVTGFTNSEEEAVGLTKVVPFLVEDELKAKGGLYSKGPDWGSYVIRDGLLITGQNPASSAAAAALLLEQPAATAKA